MKQILFVDDDDNILAGLKRRVRLQRPQWKLNFARSATEAEEISANLDLDVIISDMRMPGEDGASLLSKFQKTHPRAVRIILSGFAEEEAVLRTVGPAHQYLAKPCDDDVLIKTIDNALELQSVLVSPDLRSLIASIGSLATPPRTYEMLLNALEDPLVGPDEIAKIVSSDIALTAEILKLTNSAYFAVTQKISSVTQAIKMLGTETLKALALFVGVFSRFEGSKSDSNHLMRLCHRSQQIGVTATLIGEYEGLDREQLQIIPAAGMLGHIGSLVLFVDRRSEMTEVVRRVETEKIPIEVAEKEQFGAGHPEIGAYLLGLWGFPSALVQIVAFHHRAMDVPHSRFSALDAIYVAQHLTREIGLEKRTNQDVESRLDMAFLQSLGVEGHLPKWKEITSVVDDQYEKLTQ